MYTKFVNKTLPRQIKGLNKWRDISYLKIRGFNIVKILSQHLTVTIGNIP